MTRPICKAIDCNNKFDRYATFSNVKGAHEQLYAKIDSFFCISCFEKNRSKKAQTNDGFIGILSRTEFIKYKKRCDGDSPFHSLQRQGVVKLNLPNYPNLQQNLNYLRNMFLLKIQGKQMEELPDNFATEKKFHAHRVWKQLYPKDESNNGVSASDRDTVLNNLNSIVEEIITPHEYYGRLAKLTYESNVSRVDVNVELNQIMEQEKKISIMNGNLKRLPLNDDILTLKNANVLGRGPLLENDQQPHVDSFDDDLILIMPLLSSNGYPIKCFHSSHQINHKKLETMIGNGDGSVGFPLSLLSEELVGANEVTIIHENTIHCGGSSSGTSGSEAYPITKDQIEKVGWFKADCSTKPTDISIQFMFKNNITHTNDSRGGRAQPRWIYNVGEFIESKSLWKDSIEADIYQTRRSEATTRYFDHLSGRRSSSRKRQRCH